ncbi:MAG: hypothetical protein JRF27_07540 [Deltaproteobacteria bacterium]|nr:hypothetical protein [Deltaproteobacteria bacterium]
MALIGMRDVCWGFGDPPLLENITLQIEKGERVCLLDSVIPRCSKT